MRDKCFYLMSIEFNRGWRHFLRIPRFITHPHTLRGYVSASKFPNLTRGAITPDRVIQPIHLQSHLAYIDSGVISK